MSLKLDYYNAADGLSQEEFRLFLRLSKQNEKTYAELEILVRFFERIVEAKERQIADLNEELYQKTFKKSHK